tara:strand:+ start:3311 stop:4336 length:1026 start_codon:yes stop_codon:yes gene_type:complete
MNTNSDYIKNKRLQHSNVNYKKLKEYTWNIDANIKNIKNIIPDDILEPVVIRGFYKKTFAYNCWNVNTIGKYFGDALFDIEQYDNLEKYYSADKNLEINATTKVSNYMKYLKKNQTEPFYYLAEVDIQEKIKDDEMPNGFDMYILNPNLAPIMVKQEPHAENLFLGNNASSGCHMHIEDNYILNQVFGSKTIYLFEFDDSNHMINKNSDSLKKALKITHCEFINFISNNFFDLDHSKFNNLYKVTLNPGDSLVIPPHWWHATTGHGINCSVTTVLQRNNINYLFFPTIKKNLWILYFIKKIGIIEADNKLEYIEDVIEDNFVSILLILSGLYFYLSKKKYK